MKFRYRFSCGSERGVGTVVTRGFVLWGFIKAPIGFGTALRFFVSSTCEYGIGKRISFGIDKRLSCGFEFYIFVRRARYPTTWASARRQTTYMGSN